jgi:hypothetical protein
MGQAWNAVWLTVAFASELAALAALAYWGWSFPGSTPVRILLAVGTPLVAAALWGVFAAPQAPVRVLVLTLAVKLLVFGGAVAALLATGHPRLAVALGVLALLGSVLSSPPAEAAAGPVSGPVSGPAPG